MHTSRRQVSLFDKLVILQFYNPLYLQASSQEWRWNDGCDFWMHWQNVYHCSSKKVALHGYWWSGKNINFLHYHWNYIFNLVDEQAPRAKMNQQRSRRFRASKEIAEKVLTMSNIREELQLRGAYVPPEKNKGEHFDSNCITPVSLYRSKFNWISHWRNIFID